MQLYLFYYSLSVWEAIRDGSIYRTACMETRPCKNNYLTFGGYDNGIISPEVHSKIALSRALSVQNLVPSVEPFPTPPLPTFQASLASLVSTMSSVGLQATLHCYCYYFLQINRNPELKAITIAVSQH